MSGSLGRSFGHSRAEGRAEVETDLLLGVDDVLLPEQFERAPRAPIVEQSLESRPSAPTNRRFEADLFAGSPVAARAPAPDLGALPRREPSAGGGIVPTEPVAPLSAVSAPVAPLVDCITPPPGRSNSERLRLLEELHARECPHCTTATGHRSIVFGEGDPDAALVFVGEAPGEGEDLTGRPFVGPAGEKLDGMIAAMGLSRGQVYIANVLKTRPPANRTPLASEVERCGPYLLAQLAVIRPRAIVTLGGPATKLLLASELGITRLRGIVAKVALGGADGDAFEVPVMPTFHPAYLLRNYTAEVRGQMWSDLQQVIELLGLPRPARKRADDARA